MDLRLAHYSAGGLEVIDVEGEIDVYSAPRFRELLISLVRQGRCWLVVNMERVEFLDSTAQGVLVGGLRRSRARGGSLDLVCAEEWILTVLRVAGLTDVFDIYGSVDKALEARGATR